jgi:hypothetical protein
MFKKISIVAIIILAIYQYLYHIPNIDNISHHTSIAHSQIKQPPTESQKVSSAADTIHQAYTNHQSSIQVKGEGRVIRLLKDDLKGSRHQRFILRLPSGQTVLVAHNIDLSPRINGLQKGDIVRFYGQYEWNNKGGIIHWTHHDPNGRHINGWLEHSGRTYQ